jgi:valyl-tRNA synthetase
MIETKHYNWKEIESEILKKIPDSTFHSQHKSNLPPYSIIMPPPNVTGYLHMGHALVTTIQDTMARYKRMKGFNVLWQPGLDHAGIATQVVVEKQLKERNLNAKQLGRENFLKEVYLWKDKSANMIIEQIKRMGSSCDFSYTAFTMDDQSVEGVIRAFVELHQKGLIYKDNKLVNWDCQLQTAISDLEVENKEVKGNYYYLKYYLLNSNDYIVIATTRPETIFADEAIAVNPKDERYINLIGKEVLVPIINKKIKIIADDYADITKGSGAVKITPAHDFNDFEVGKRHNLAIVNLLNPDGTLNENVPDSYIGLSIEKARKQIIEELTKLELIEKVEPTLIITPFGDRSNSVIEPRLTKQWFLNTTDMAEKAMEVVANSKVEFIPDNWKNLYFDWMRNIKPWCISRQLWWGHRIPAWYDDQGNIFVAKNQLEAEQLAFEKHHKKVNLTQDNDVLDTWFSSSLWPFLTLGWNEQSEKLKTFYPTSLLVTGFDIIFFWVARMVMMGVFFMNDVPFKKVYIHALIRDEKGQKMSKSKGNVIDPLDIIDKYGTDALRFTLLSYCGHGRDIKLAEKSIEGYRNFITKIFNSYKFAMMNGAVYNANFDINNVKSSLNKWLLAKLEDLIINVEKAFDGHRFNDVANHIYQFIWGDFCDWYVELIKPVLNGKDEEAKQEIKETLGYTFDVILKVAHPLIPFITQHLFENLHKDENIVLAKLYYPNLKNNFDSYEIQKTQNLIGLIAKIRSLRADLNVPASSLVSMVVQNPQEYITKNQDIIMKLARLESIKIVNEIQDDFIQDIYAGGLFGLKLGNFIDIKTEIDRLNKSLLKQQEELDKVLNKLNNKQFMEKASVEVIETFQILKAELLTKIDNINDLLKKILQ